MKFFSQLKEALLEKVALTGLPPNVSEARFWYNDILKRFQYRDNTANRILLSEDLQQTISNKALTTGVTITNPDQLQPHSDTQAGLDAVVAVGGFAEGDLLYNTTDKKYYGIEGTGVSQELVGLGGGSRVFTGTFAIPIDIDASVGIQILNEPHEVQFIKGDIGAVDITASPQIPIATADAGAMLTLIGTGVDTVRLDDGNGLSINGPYILGANESITLMWDGVLWRDIAANF